MILHRQNFIEALSILSATNDLQIQICVKNNQAVLQTEHTEIILKTREVNPDEFAVLYCNVTRADEFDKLCAILNIIKDEYINISFTYDEAAEVARVEVIADTFKGAFNTGRTTAIHVDIDHAAATELFTITDEIYAALSTAKEHCQSDADSVCVSETHIFATDGKTAFLYPIDSPEIFPMPQHVINSRLKGATLYVNETTIYIINRNFKQRIDRKKSWDFSTPAKLNNVLEMMKGESTQQTVDCKHLRKSIAIASAVKSETVSLSIHETACVDMYSDDVTGSTVIAGSGDDMAAEITTYTAAKILDSPFSQRCDKITIGTHKMVLSLNFNKATFIATNKAYGARERDVIRRYMNGDESVLLGWSNPYELFKNNYKPWIEVRNEELRRERDKQNKEIIAGLRSKIVNIEAAKATKELQAERDAALEEINRLNGSPADSHNRIIAKSEISVELDKLEKEHETAKASESEQQAEFEKIEDVKERNAALKVIRTKQAARLAVLKPLRDKFKELIALEKQIGKLQKRATDIDSKIKPQTFIKSNTLEQIEAHNLDILEQIQEVLCRQ